MKDYKNGCFLVTREEIMKEQKNWDEFDSYKNFDFSVSPFWMTTDNGEEPWAFETEEEADAYIARE